jgi:hypothetical protein
MVALDGNKQGGDKPRPYKDKPRPYGNKPRPYGDMNRDFTGVRTPHGDWNAHTQTILARTA